MRTGSNRSARRGLNLVEILIAVSILGLAMAPIIGIMNRSYGQIRWEKMEATAANYAGKKLNEVLFDMAFRDVHSKIGTTWSGTEPEIDGTVIEWTFDVRAVPVAFLVQKVPYHAPHAGGEPGAPTLPPAVVEPIARMDNKMTDLSTTLLDIRLQIRWRGQEESIFTRERTQVLYTRKARLE